MKKILCFIFGHNFVILRKINKDIQELYCSRCKRDYAISHQEKILLPLDDELRIVHNYLLHEIEIEELKQELKRN